MIALPRIFVGTLYAGEAEFEESQNAIANQERVQIYHHVIKDLPEYEAHNRLWSAWNARKYDFDLFVKVDADTILNRATALAEIYALFEGDVTGVQIPLWDYFTDDLINGLNAFSPAVVFKPSKSRLFADHADRGHKTVLKGDRVAHLAPIGFHAKYPNPKQAFAYGYRRALKGQTDVLHKLRAAYLSKRGEGRAWALYGASCATKWDKILLPFYNRDFSTQIEKIAATCTIHDVIQPYLMQKQGA